jgi:uncharacterized SAM-binding protein YcdF (DUF218 family)
MLQTRVRVASKRRHLWALAAGVLPWFLAPEWFAVPVAQALESRFERTMLGDPASVTGVVVLGGGEARLREAARLAARNIHLRVFVSGAGAPAYIRRVMGEIAPERLEIETLSQTTYDNAVNAKRLARPEAHERWLLVTSATHMARAMGAFTKVGFAVEPWPVYDAGAAPERAASAQHEVLGLGYYWLLGRTPELYPRPRNAARRLGDLTQG